MGGRRAGQHTPFLFLPPTPIANLQGHTWKYLIVVKCHVNFTRHFSIYIFIYKKRGMFEFLRTTQPEF